ncbi:hypothetical protein B0H19DRAFT_1162418 [Mycena capillaripes]|nr:hypothetical protein B0H19DRAFT_1162418 [Mycena capillaripes]
MRLRPLLCQGSTTTPLRCGSLPPSSPIRAPPIGRRLDRGVERMEVVVGTQRVNAASGISIDRCKDAPGLGELGNVMMSMRGGAARLWTYITRSCRAMDSERRGRRQQEEERGRRGKEEDGQGM